MQLAAVRLPLGPLFGSGAVASPLFRSKKLLPRGLKCSNSESVSSASDVAVSEVFFASGGDGKREELEERTESARYGEEKPTFEEKVESDEPSNGAGGSSEDADGPSFPDVKLDFDDAPSVILYGAGALLALWVSSAVVSAIDSVPLFPKLMEVVGLGFTVWFGWRYLLFKENRDELYTKINELKTQILGFGDE